MAPSSTSSPSSAQEQPAQQPEAPATASRGRAKRQTLKKQLVLDVKAVADADGLAQEVAVLRASIRQLANDGDMAEHVKVLAELRHQIEALCRALKTQQSLAGHDDGGRAAEMTRLLEELGDDLGVAR
jgi:hypothetical protein